LLGFSFRHRHSYVAQYLSLAILTIGLTTLLGCDDLLAAFTCGSSFTWDGFFNKQTEDSVFSSVIDTLFNVAAFFAGAWMLFGPFHSNVQSGTRCDGSGSSLEIGREGVCVASCRPFTRFADAGVGLIDRCVSICTFLHTYLKPTHFSTIDFFVNTTNSQPIRLNAIHPASFDASRECKHSQSYNTYQY
jgi:hypothetical protein